MLIRQVVSTCFLHSVRHLTPTSSKWLQLWTQIPVFWQSYRLVSLPVQTTLSNQMDPVPWPKKAKKKAVAPVGKSDYQISTVYVSMFFRGYQLKRVPVVCRLHQHWWTPTCCHTLFPMLHYSKSQLDPQYHSYHHE